ncbi:ABC transporter permease [Saccharibacter sp. 17.LH.SD]|nr:ABC transporter permease [Saccharibacter sp. 17.LH.SD]
MSLKEVIGLFKLQYNVIVALIYRELNTRFGRENIGFLWFAGEPALFCAGVAIVWTAIRSPFEHGLPMTAIVITGYVPLTMWRHCIGRSTKAFEANGSLLFHRQVTPVDIISARMYLEIIGTIAGGIVVYLAAFVMGSIKLPSSIGLIVLGLFFQAWFSYNTGLLVASLSERTELLEKVVGMASYLALPLTGAFVMVDWIPQKYRWILMSSPSSEAIEMVRAGQFGFAAHAHYDITYTICVNFILTIIGLHLTMTVKRYIIIQ